MQIFLKFAKKLIVQLSALKWATFATSEPQSMVNFNQFTVPALKVAASAYDILQKHKHAQVDTTHLFLALLDPSNDSVLSILEKLHVNLAELKNDLLEALKNLPVAGVAKRDVVYITLDFKIVMDQATEEATKLNDQHAGPEHMLLAISSERPSTPTGQTLAKHGIATARIRSVMQQMRELATVTPFNPEQLPVGTSNNDEVEKRHVE